ncbi:hypothetical protein R6Q59_012440 [Mikania micrantha]
MNQSGNDDNSSNYGILLKKSKGKKATVGMHSTNDGADSFMSPYILLGRSRKRPRYEEIDLNLGIESLPNIGLNDGPIINDCIIIPGEELVNSDQGMEKNVAGSLEERIENQDIRNMEVQPDIQNQEMEETIKLADSIDIDLTNFKKQVGLLQFLLHQIPSPKKSSWYLLFQEFYKEATPVKKESVPSQAKDMISSNVGCGTVR